MFRVALNTTVRTALRTAVTSSARKNVVTASRSLTQQTQTKKFNPFLIGGGIAFATSGVVLATSMQVVNASSPNYTEVRAMIAKIIEDEPSHGPLFVRLAWHASGTYEKSSNTGGSNGATMRYKPESDDEANNGLGIARNLLESVKKAHPQISYADLWTLAGVVAIEEMGGPKIGWSSGRTDEPPTTTKVPANGRLPDADKGSPQSTAAHVRQVFNRMGFNDREIVALLGAHALGRCHPDRSGYSGPWTRAETTFSNEYFRELIENKWTEKKWKGPKQFEDPTGQLMMLPADLVLIQDPEFKKYVELYAKDEGIFFADFAKAFQKLEELGFSPSKSLWDKFTGLFTGK